MEAFERERERYARQTEMIKRKVEDVQYPLQQLEISYTDPTQCKDYSIYEDRFLLVEIAKYGVGQDDVYQRIKRDIDECPAFRFDRFMTSVSTPSTPACPFQARDLLLLP